MQKPGFLTALVFLTLVAPLAQAADVTRVFVSVLPEQTFVERVGGRHVKVESLVKPGFSPHTYEPTPNQIARLAEASVYVGIGLPFERAWIERIRATNPDIRVLDLSQGIALRRIEAHDDADEADGHALAEDARDPHRHEQAESELDPHIWTSPVLVKAMGDKIAAALSALDPAHAGDYASNLAAFQADLDALDRDIRAQLAGLKHRRFMVFHPAWGYFADTYGLAQIPIEREGKDPGPRSLKALIDQARKADVKVIFVQPQFSRKSADQVARAIGGRVEVIDNLAPNYFENLRGVARVIAESER